VTCTVATKGHHGVTPRVGIKIQEEDRFQVGKGRMLADWTSIDRSNPRCSCRSAERTLGSSVTQRADLTRE
jgi:hypothetical protein